MQSKSELELLVIILKDAKIIINKFKECYFIKEKQNNYTHLNHFDSATSKISTSIRRLNEFKKLNLYRENSNSFYDNSKKTKNISKYSIFEKSEGYLLLSQLESTGMTGSPLTSKISILKGLIKNFISSGKFEYLKKLIDYLSDLFDSLSIVIPYLDEAKELLDLISNFNFDDEKFLQLLKNSLSNLGLIKIPSIPDSTLLVKISLNQPI